MFNFAIFLEEACHNYTVLLSYLVGPTDTISLECAK